MRVAAYRIVIPFHYFLNCKTKYAFQSSTFYPTKQVKLNMYSTMDTPHYALCSAMCVMEFNFKTRIESFWIIFMDGFVSVCVWNASLNNFTIAQWTFCTFAYRYPSIKPKLTFFSFKFNFMMLSFNSIVVRVVLLTFAYGNNHRCRHRHRLLLRLHIHRMKSHSQHKIYSLIIFMIVIVY